MYMRGEGGGLGVSNKRTYFMDAHLRQVNFFLVVSRVCGKTNQIEPMRLGPRIFVSKLMVERKKLSGIFSAKPS